MERGRWKRRSEEKRSGVLKERVELPLAYLDDNLIDRLWRLNYQLSNQRIELTFILQRRQLTIK